MNDLKKISHYFRSRISRRNYLQLLAHSAEVLYGPGTSAILISAFGVAAICVRSFLRNLLKDRGQNLINSSLTYNDIQDRRSYE